MSLGIFDQKNRKLWIVVGIIIIVLFLNQPEIDKKESTGEWGKIGMGLGGIGVGLWIALASGPIGWAAIAIAGGAFLLGGAGLFSGIAGLFTPDKLIPGWAWIGGFIVLALWALKGRK